MHSDYTPDALRDRVEMEDEEPKEAGPSPSLYRARDYREPEPEIESPANPFGEIRRLFDEQKREIADLRSRVGDLERWKRGY